MITTRDIKIEEAEPGKTKIVTTNKIRPKVFVTRGKGAPRDRTIITTADLRKAEMKKNRKRGKKK